MVEPLEERLVVPFYLKMMGLNALREAEGLWGDLVRLGRGVGDAEVRQLLAPDHWRPVVMGAWFSLRSDREQVGDEILAAVGMCRGSLTAPPLAVAAALVVGPDSVPALVAYVERDVSGGDGSAAFVSAVIETMAADAPVVVGDADRAACASLLGFGRRLRGALTQA